MRKTKLPKQFQADIPIRRTGNKSFEEIKKIIEAIREETLKLEKTTTQFDGRVL